MNFKSSVNIGKKGTILLIVQSVINFIYRVLNIESANDYINITKYMTKI